MLRLRLPMFDRRLGGLPRGSRCIFMTSPSIDPSTIGIHVAKAGLEEGYRTDKFFFEPCEDIEGDEKYFRKIVEMVYPYADRAKEVMEKDERR